MKSRLPLFVILASLLSACGGLRLQTSNEATNEVNKSMQHQAERQCDQHGGQQRIDCQRQIRLQYEAQRLKNAESLR